MEGNKINDPRLRFLIEYARNGAEGSSFFPSYLTANYYYYVLKITSFPATRAKKCAWSGDFLSKYHYLRTVKTHTAIVFD